MNCFPTCSHEGNGHCKTFHGSLVGGGFSYGKLAFKCHWVLSLTKGRKLKAKGDTLSLTYIFMPFIPFFPTAKIKDRGINWFPRELPAFSDLPPQMFGGRYHQTKQLFPGVGNLGRIFWFTAQKTSTASLVQGEPVLPAAWVPIPWPWRKG